MNASQNEHKNHNSGGDLFVPKHKRTKTRKIASHQAILANLKETDKHSKNAEIFNVAQYGKRHKTRGKITTLKRAIVKRRKFDIRAIFFQNTLDD